MGNSEYMKEAFRQTLECATNFHHEYYCPEHLLYAFLLQSRFQQALTEYGADPEAMRAELLAWLEKQDQLPTNEEDVIPTSSMQFNEMYSAACRHSFFASREEVDVPHFIYAMLSLEESEANYLLKKYLKDDAPDFLSILIGCYEMEGGLGGDDTIADDSDFDADLPYGLDSPFDDDMIDEEDATEGKQRKQAWRRLVTCMNDRVGEHNPLIGREQELERTMQVLCRKEKNNPLHVGEPGVGKTALVYGLAARIERGDVPERLKGCKIYQMDMGSMLAGTQFRGDFEKRIKMVMEGVAKEGNGIIYIDEIHNMIGAGRGSDGGPDASNMLKPYLESGDIRFIGSTTYDEYNRRFAQQRGIVRRFQQIDIAEPSVDEAVQILMGLRKQYEDFHGVKYPKAVIEYAVKQSARLVSDRFLPDKAIDLIDEAGAQLEMETEKTETEKPKVTQQLVGEILAKVCKVDAAALKEDDNSLLKTLKERMLQKIYGQDEAVRQVVEAVQMAKAGLIDDDKPLGSLLFVGPTGVGKTEVARQLANELGVQLVRFDMSEYTEKHAVAKLIGSPAGYVGYEDGGLLTDAIRKTPNCVLLLDEIEKAHQDIYNILLQVMDYARLTDNRGQKADFRNVVVIMTSNAGAQFASQAGVGFQSKVTRGEAMLAQVKKTFKPEFLNRLSGTVVFHDMDERMASMILDKKLRELQQKLTNKKVELTLSDEARALLLKRGFTREYGAREMDRVIGHDVKPLLMRELLFGKLRKGGKAVLTADGDTLKVNVNRR
ncbi:MAG: AAA family ATPase [Prevotella sp.]|nr:AAA family ATPase [Prevotella sp.]